MTNQELSKQDYIESLINELTELDDLELCNVITKAVHKKDSFEVDELLAAEALEFWASYKQVLDALISYESYLNDVADVSNPAEIAELITFNNAHKVAYNLGYDSIKQEAAQALYEELAYILDKGKSNE